MRRFSQRQYLLYLRMGGDAFGAVGMHSIGVLVRIEQSRWFSIVKAHSAINV